MIEVFTEADSFISKIKIGDEQNIIELTVKKDTQEQESFQIPDLLLKFDYPSESFIADSIKFVVIKKTYQNTTKNIKQKRDF